MKVPPPRRAPERYREPKGQERRWTLEALALILALAAGPAESAAQAGINIDGARETLVGQWKGMARQQPRDLYEVRVREVKDNGQIEGRGCIVPESDMMTTVALVHAQLEDERTFLTRTKQVEIRFAVSSPGDRAAIVELTPLGGQARTQTTGLRRVGPDARTLCLHRFSDEPVTANRVEPSAEYPIIGQWTNAEQHDGAVVELEFSEVHEDARTVTGRKCTKDYHHHGMRLIDLGTGRRAVRTRMTNHGRTITTRMYTHRGHIQHDTYTRNDDDTLTHAWRIVDRGGKVLGSGLRMKRRGALEDGCLAHTTRRAG